MHTLTPEETLRHIHHKMSMRELDPRLGQRMIELFDEDPSLDYRQLRIAALHRPLPDIAFHVTSTENRDSISERGLIPADPRDGWRSVYISGQPTAVYLSDLEEASDGRHSQFLPCDVWRVDGLEVLAPDWVQDAVNPTCWAVLSAIPQRMLTLHDTVH